MKLTNKLIPKKIYYARPNTSTMLFKNKYFLFLKINCICIKHTKKNEIIDIIECTYIGNIVDILLCGNLHHCYCILPHTYI